MSLAVQIFLAAIIVVELVALDVRDTTSGKVVWLLALVATLAALVVVHLWGRS